MRLWSLHPKHLDPAGLVALWREGLLAKSVLERDHNEFGGYSAHPQLKRFTLPLLHIYLKHVLLEADNRGYQFDRSKIPDITPDVSVHSVTKGQLDYEREHLQRKLDHRNEFFAQKLREGELEQHPLFFVTDGPIASWERV